jgi:hypothetical protein
VLVDIDRFYQQHSKMSDLRARVRSLPYQNVTFQPEFESDIMAGPSTGGISSLIEERTIYERQDGGESRKPLLVRTWASLDLRNVCNSADAQGLPTAADFFVPSLPGLPNMASHPT